MTENLDAFFTDMAIVVVWNATTFKGLLDSPDETVANGMVIDADQSVLVKSSSVVGIKSGDAITVDGSSLTVKYAKKIDDGALSRIWV